MPHFTFEYSANLDRRLDMQVLCEETRRAALASGLFEEGAVRVRAVRCESYAIADLLPENAFLDLSIRIGTGRTADDKRRMGEAVFAAVSAFCGQLFDSPHFALSQEVREIDADLSWRRNAIHPRLRGR